MNLMKSFNFFEVYKNEEQEKAGKKGGEGGEWEGKLDRGNMYKVCYINILISF
jgi:hypothetical protein